MHLRASVLAVPSDHAAANNPPVLTALEALGCLLLDDEFRDAKLCQCCEPPRAAAAATAAAAAGDAAAEDAAFFATLLVRLGEATAGKGAAEMAQPRLGGAQCDALLRIFKGAGLQTRPEPFAFSEAQKEVMRRLPLYEMAASPDPGGYQAAAATARTQSGGAEAPAAAQEAEGSSGAEGEGTRTALRTVGGCFMFAPTACAGLYKPAAGDERFVRYKEEWVELYRSLARPAQTPRLCLCSAHS